MPSFGESRQRATGKQTAKRPIPGEPRQKPKQTSRRYVMWLLGRREYSASELRKKVINRGYSVEEADDALTFAQEYQFQSDERYAGMKAHSTAHRAGNRRIAMVLKSKGIEEDLAESQIATLAPEDERAVDAAGKFRSQVETAGMSRELSQKIWRFLSYRGFGSSAIRAAIDALSRTAE